MAAPQWSLAIHGGAGAMTPETLTPEEQARYEAALGLALDAGTRVLAEGGLALDAVEAAVTALEDDPLFNAGRGAVFTYAGAIEHDAAIMDGSTRDAGAIAGVGQVRHPVRLARAVMEHSPHVFLAGQGAEEFAAEQDIAAVDPAWFATPERRRQLEEFKARKGAWFDSDIKYGTVGAVARDSHGNLAAATSTGGLTGKRWNRIGDSPVIGAGTYADNRSGAVSATGAGELFIRVGVAHEICARMRLTGAGLQDAADAVLAEVAALGGKGGVIVAAPDGATAFAFTTPGMHRARADGAGLREIAIFGPRSGA
ncbi:isoaspartyl peptidase/L-asparaginase family protein [Altericroceibacterium xinjiangense]|uniref:isoaspartyl peptidase/L-asparaginase family protein n=1 Tax=Altericroceibacterium xinjiangense TaxID=762261 RepID=UPI000F7E94E7|nr:isoaspartyl peptidase/L-asparaginase [Altericroceibacterium xinjiangense]